jgi:hypothetical protein
MQWRLGFRRLLLPDSKARVLRYGLSDDRGFEPGRCAGNFPGLSRLVLLSRLGCRSPRRSPRLGQSQRINSFSVKSDSSQRSFRCVMPRTGLCRVGEGDGSVLRRISSCSGSGYRHNYRLSRNASNGSVGRKRSGARPDGVSWARARSLSFISACK